MALGSMALGSVVVSRMVGNRAVLRRTVPRGATGRAALVLFLVLAPVIVLAARPGSAAAAGEPAVDCAKAFATSEVAACAERDYKAADRDLNAAYRAATAAVEKTDMPADAKADYRGALVEAQRRWIAYRDAECALTGFEWYGGTGRGIAEISCARELTEARTKALRQHAAGR